MDTHKSLLLFLHTCLLFSSSTESVLDDQDDPNKHQNYIIIVQKPADFFSYVVEDVESWHNSLLSAVCKNSAASRRIYSYHTVLSGFAARLSELEVKLMSKLPWFVRAILDNKPYKLLTTHTPQFLGLRSLNGVWNTKNMGEGIIIAVLDSGIYPDHPSFNEDGMLPPPAKWKGRCDFNASICNNKLIGAKSFLKGDTEKASRVPPFDLNGHGTHTASTAAGTFVNASVRGNDLGVASGMAPRAHLAIYRVCNVNDCRVIDIVKGMDEAVNDGVDVISLSIGSGSVPLYMDPIAIGGYSAIRKGVFVSAAAGNDGPNPYTLSNEAPWVLTVAASTTDRKVNTTTLTSIPSSTVVAEFSSRGPSLPSPLIIKPDITGPGVDVLAAVPPNFRGQVGVQFEFLSGTSMAVPHLSGIAALIKKAHPHWSPAAIKSAIMTTASITKHRKPIGDESTLKPTSAFAIGAGLVNPIKATDPGLVYDLTPQDYISYLCSLGYADADIATIVHPGPPVRCSTMPSIPIEQLNYPSIAVPQTVNSTLIIRRTVTNVGVENAIYKAVVHAPDGLTVEVVPRFLRFKKVGQKMSFQLVMKWDGSVDPTKMQGELKWVSYKHKVRSPIVLPCSQACIPRD